VLLRRPLHALLEQRLELGALLLGLALELMQELALFVVDLAVGEEQPIQKRGRLPRRVP
jgi:hypothetical protein